MEVRELGAAEIEWQIARLNTRYAQCLDDDRLEEWPELFVDDCRYMIHPRENKQADLEGYWLYFDSKGMLRDRITSLRKANLYNIHQDRRMVSSISIESCTDGVYCARASYLVIQTDVEGRARVFSAGEYRDQIVFTPEGPKFKERLVVPDNFNVEGMIAVPL